MQLFSEDSTDKRISRLERDLNRRMQRMEESFAIMRDSVLKLKKENAELRSDRDFLLGKYRDLLGKIAIEPVRQVVADNARLLERVAKDGIISQEKLLEGLKKDYKAPLDGLFEMVMAKKKVRLRDAAKKFRVHEGKIEEWARVLQEHGLIDAHYPESGEPLLLKKSL